MTLKNPFSMIQIKPKVKSELQIDIKKLQEETLLNLQNSKAINTVRAYKSDFKDLIILRILKLTTLLEHTNLILRILAHSVLKMVLSHFLQSLK